MGKKQRRKNNKPARLNLGEENCLPTPEFMARHQLDKIKIEKKNVLRVRDRRPFAKYHRLYCIDQERGIAEQYRCGITEDQFRAADRLSNNYEHSFSKMAMPLDAIKVQSSINMGLYPIESITNAIHQHMRIMRELSRVSQEIIEEICCKETNLNNYEIKKGWRKGYGMIRLREALDEVIEAYKTIASRRNSENQNNR